MNILALGPSLAKNIKMPLRTASNSHYKLPGHQEIHSRLSSHQDSVVFGMPTKPDSEAKKKADATTSFQPPQDRQDKTDRTSENSARGSANGDYSFRSYGTLSGRDRSKNSQYGNDGDANLMPNRAIGIIDDLLREGWSKK